MKGGYSNKAPLCFRKMRNGFNGFREGWGWGVKVISGIAYSNQKERERNEQLYLLLELSCYNFRYPPKFCQ